jgi:hypothetical protein
MTGNSPRHLLFLFGLVTAVLVWLAAGVASAAAAGPDPCGLLTTAEVEHVAGEGLVGPPFRVSNGIPNPDGRSCRYELAAFRAIDVEVDWSNGGQRFALINMASGIIDNGGLKGVIFCAANSTHCVAINWWSSTSAPRVPQSSRQQRLPILRCKGLISRFPSTGRPVWRVRRNATGSGLLRRKRAHWSPGRRPKRSSARRSSPIRRGTRRSADMPGRPPTRTTRSS